MIKDNSNKEEIDVNNDILNYKGYFVENADEDDEPKYFEFGAHFRYKDLYNALKIIKQKKLRQIMEKKEEKIMSQPKTKKIENKERNNTKNNNKNKNLTLENNIQNILKGFKSRIRSRNIGVEQQNDNQNELTFVIRNKNNFSVKKDEKNINSLYGNKTNFTKVNNNNMKKSLNNNNSKNLNKKISIRNNHEKNNFILTNKKFQKNKSNIDKNKLSNKNILSRNQEQNNLYQQVQIPPSNKTINHYNLNMNFYKSYKTQISKLNNNGGKAKLFNFDESSFNSHSKENDDTRKLNYINKNNQNMIQKNNSNLTEPKLMYNSLNKNISNSKNKNLKLDKIEYNNLNNDIVKNNINKASGKPGSFNLDKVIKDTLLKGYKSKNSKFSPKKSQTKFIPTDSGKFPSKYKFNSLTRNQKDIRNISLNKNKLNENSDYIDNRGVISVSMDNNKKYLSNNITIEKLKTKGKYDNSSIVHISLNNQSSNNNNSNCTTNPDLINKNKNFGKNYMSNNQNYENMKLKNKKSRSKKEEPLNNKQLKKNKNNSQSNKNKDLFNLLDKNEMHSRNKNNNYFLNNISSINFTNKKTINTSCNNNNKKNNFSNINNIKKINITLQNNKLIRFKNHKIQIRNKVLNFNKNLNNNNNKNNNSKKDKIEISSTSKKKLFTSSNGENYLLNNNYKTELINKKINFNNLFINRSKKRIKLTKNIMHRTITKENTFIKSKNINKSSNNNDMNPNKSDASNNVFQLNDIKNNSWGIKKYETFIKKKSKKNNININININNNNKIIYNKIVDNKTHGSNNISKAVKSPSLQKIRSYVNNSTYEMRSKNMVNNGKKIKFINIQFPKAKFLNLYNSNTNK